MNQPLTKYELDRATGVDLAIVGVALDENARFGALRNQYWFNSTIFSTGTLLSFRENTCFQESENKDFS